MIDPNTVLFYFWINNIYICISFCILCRWWICKFSWDSPWHSSHTELSRMFLTCLWCSPQVRWPWTCCGPRYREQAVSSYGVAEVSRHSLRSGCIPGPVLTSIHSLLSIPPSLVLQVSGQIVEIFMKQRINLISNHTETKAQFCVALYLRWASLCRFY